MHAHRPHSQNWRNKLNCLSMFFFIKKPCNLKPARDNNDYLLNRRGSTCCIQQRFFLKKNYWTIVSPFFPAVSTVRPIGNSMAEIKVVRNYYGRHLIFSYAMWHCVSQKKKHYYVRVLLHLSSYISVVDLLLLLFWTQVHIYSRAKKKKKSCSCQAYTTCDKFVIWNPCTTVVDPYFNKSSNP